jgi:peroxiredoxin
MGDLLGSAAAGLVIVASAIWIVLVRRVSVPANRTPFVFAYVSAMALGVAALMFPVSTGARIGAWLAVVVSGAFISLRIQSPEPDIEPAVTLGEPIHDFVAPDEKGESFDTASLRGRPWLLKFFRGHWSPHCVAELRRWSEIEDELALQNIAVVTVCCETPEAIARGRRRHGLAATMLADPECDIATRFNLCNDRALGPRGWGPQAIPTTILVDATGNVRWIDRATDSQVRTQPGRVLAAVRDALA